MARKTIIVCDLCESAQGVRAWEVKADSGEKKKVELCVTHSNPFARLFEPQGEGSETEVTTPRRGGGRRRTPVVEE